MHLFWFTVPLNLKFMLETYRRRRMRADAIQHTLEDEPHRLGLSSLTIVSIKVGSGSSAAAVDRRIGISLRVHIPRVHLFQAMF